MPAYSACGADLYDITDGAPGDKVLGMQSVGWNESMDVGDYTDNTTACGKDPLKGPVTREGSVTINLQETARGWVPYRAGDEKTFRIFVGGSTSNYWDITVLIISMDDHTYDLSSTDPVSVSYNFRVYGSPTPNGSVATGSGS